MTGDPEFDLSVVLVAPGGFEPLRRLVRYLAEQTIRERLEILVVGESNERLGVDEGALACFKGYQVLEAGPITSLNLPRAAGIRAARAPIVALTEDHCFPARDWAEALVAAHRGPWAAVGPGVGLANPQRYRAWTNFLVQYGPWIQPASSREVTDLPGHNSSYKRAILLDYGERLSEWLVADSTLHWDLRRHGHRLYLYGNARVHHVFMSRLSPFLAENYYIGRQFAASRAAHWSVFTRAAFALGSPAIPLVRAVRALKRMAAFGWLGALLPGILPSLASALAVSAAGEFMGYAFGLGNAAMKTVDLDFRRDRFVSEEEREAIWGEALTRFPEDLPVPRPR